MANLSPSLLLPPTLCVVPQHLVHHAVPKILLRSPSHRCTARPTAETCLNFAMGGPVALAQETHPTTGGGTGSAAGEEGRWTPIWLYVVGEGTRPCKHWDKVNVVI